MQRTFESGDTADRAQTRKELKAARYFLEDDLKNPYSQSENTSRKAPKQRPGSPHRLWQNEEGSVQDYPRFENGEKTREGSNETILKKGDLKRILHYHLRSCVNPDILIKIGSNNIYCHRILLRSYTNFFDNAELLGDNCSVSIPEDKVSLKAFEAVYNWMLLGGEESFKLVNRKNFLDVFMASQYLKIKELVEMCQGILENEELYSEGNAFFLYMDAFHSKNEKIMEMMLPRIQKFYLTLVSSKDFVHIPYEVLCNLLQSNFISVHSELEVFMSGVRWLIHNWDERSKLAYNVMKHIRFGLMTPSQLVDIKRNPDSPEILKITSDPKVQQLIDDGMAFAVKVHCHDGDFDEVTQACKKLGLTPPAMRNWAGTEKKYKKYQDFLNELEEIHKEKKQNYQTSFYSTK